VCSHIDIRVITLDVLAIDVNVLEYYSFSGSKYNQEHCVGSVCSHMHRQLKM
jgi:hypothetical protein